uniref:Uncharacterized protein n=1 Tax=Arundo donax TaxID=35708 RepID=A0A0A9A6K7_ARUDO
MGRLLAARDNSLRAGDAQGPRGASAGQWLAENGSVTGGVQVTRGR